MTQLSLTFTGALGDELEARLDLPDGEDPRAYVLFAHCFTGSKDVLAAVRIAKARRFIRRPNILKVLCRWIRLIIL